MPVSVTICAGPLGCDPPCLKCDGAGAVVVFEGRVRRLEDGREIRGLEYEAYEPMAQNMLREISEELLGKFGLIGIAVEHSKGMVLVGECSFRLQVAAPHRREALEAMGHFIDRLKRDVPIWKKAAEHVDESHAKAQRRKGIQES